MQKKKNKKADESAKSIQDISLCILLIIKNSLKMITIADVCFFSAIIPNHKKLSC